MQERRVSWSVQLETTLPPRGVLELGTGDGIDKYGNHFDEQDEEDNPDEYMEQGQQEPDSKTDPRENGLSFSMTAFFIVAQMIGTGFLTLPRAIADTGWVGIFLLIILGGSICFTGIRLGSCWIILEERWPETYGKPARQPYMEIAFRAFGIRGRRFVLVLLLAPLIGVSVLFLALIAEMLSDLMQTLSQCQLVCIVAFILVPFTWFGTPKDFWQASVLAVVATIVAVIVLIAKIIQDYGAQDSLSPDPLYEKPSFASFSVGFGAILFAFGGANVFPTLQNDMKERKQFSKAAIMGFSVMGALYLPVAFLGYYYIGSNVKSNIFLSVESDVYLKFAMGVQILNIAATQLIVFNPVAQTIEDLLSIPKDFCWQRAVHRSCLVAVEALIALAVPDFSLIVNLIGGSAVPFLSFIIPPLIYMKLIDNKTEKHWPERSIPKWERIFLWINVAVGVMGGVSATYWAVRDIFSVDTLAKSCFVQFGRPEQNTTTEFS